MEIADSVIRTTWETLIAKVGKYYPKSKNSEFEQWQFVISKNKTWMFDVLNKVWCNMDGNGCWHDITHPVFRPQSNHRDGYTDLEQMKQYQITSHRWLNGNTLIIIRIEKY